METWKLGYEKAKNKAKQLYSKIGRIKSPALNNDDVSFSRLGFNHLIRKGRIPRTKNEQKRRFGLLPFIEKVVKNPKAIIIYRKETIKEKVNRHGEKILVESIAHFWTFVEKVKDCTVKIVIRQKNSGKKHFFSIMGDNVQTSRGRKKKLKKPKIKKSP